MHYVLAMLEIVAAECASSRAGRRSSRRRPCARSRRSFRSRIGSSIAAGAASRTGSRGATATSGIGPENATSYPHPGELALYPGGQSETELLFPYGYCNFASKAGQLWANHFATLVEGPEQLPALGKLTLWQGAQAISFREI